MKNIILSLGLGLLSCALAATAGDKLLIGGCGWNQLKIIDKNTSKTEWTHTIPGYVDCNSAVRTSDGKIFYANRKNARLIDADQNIIWEYPTRQNEELYTSIELKGGTLLLGICGLPARFVELSKDGRELRQVTFDTGIRNVHSQFRSITKTGKGNYLVSLLGRKLGVEVDDKGNIVREVPLPFPAFALKELADGNWMLSGDGGNIAIINPETREVIRRINNKNLEGAKLLYAAEAVMLDNGNILVSNWNGHSKDKTQPKLIEIDKDNKVVWKLDSPEEIRNISTVSIVPRSTGPITTM